MSIQGGAAVDVVYPEFWDSFLERDCQYVCQGMRTPLYPIPTDEVLGDQTNPEHPKFQYRFRLPQRDALYTVDMFYHGPDLRGELITTHSRQPDEFGMRFEGDTTQGVFHSFGKARAFNLGPNSGVWAFSTLWSEIGYFSPRLLQNEVSGRLRATGETRLVDKRLPLVPFRHPGINCEVGGDRCLIGKSVCMKDGSHLVLSCLVCRLLGREDACGARYIRVIPTCSDGPDCGFFDRAGPNNLIRREDDPVFTHYLESNKVASLSEYNAERRMGLLGGFAFVGKKGFQTASHWWNASAPRTNRSHLPSGLISPPSKILDLTHIHSKRASTKGVSIKGTSAETPSSHTKVDPLEGLTGPQKRQWAINNAIPPVRPTGPLPPQPNFGISNKRVNAVASGSTLPKRPIEASDSDNPDPFLINGVEERVDNIPKKRKLQPVNALHAETMQFLQSLYADQQPEEPEATNTTDHTPCESELRRLEEVIGHLQSENNALNLEVKSLQAIAKQTPKHNLEQQIALEVRITKKAREDLMKACQAFINLLKATTPAGSVPTVYQGEPSKALLKEFLLSYPRGTRENLWSMRPKSDQEDEEDEM